MYRVIGSLLFSIAVVLSRNTTTHVKSLLFLTSFIIMFSTMRIVLNKIALYPTTSPLRNSIIVYGSKKLLPITHAIL